MRVLGKIDDPRINESSGLAASIRNPGLFWTHNDSGDSPRLFLINGQGAVQEEFRVEGAEANDWEDMCSFELDGEPYLLVGDVGDNPHRREFVSLYLVAEPTYHSGKINIDTHRLGVTRRIDFTYAEGPQDCESVAFDPVRREVVIVTKVDPRQRLTGKARVYVLPLPEESTAEPIVVEKAAELDLRITVAADISPDGRRAVVATYGDAWQYVRESDESWAAAFVRPGHRIELGPRGQSEAIAFAEDGKTLLLTAEKVGRPLWWVSPVEDHSTDTTYDTTR